MIEQREPRFRVLCETTVIDTVAEKPVCDCVTSADATRVAEALNRTPAEFVDYHTFSPLRMSVADLALGVKKAFGTDRALRIIRAFTPDPYGRMRDVPEECLPLLETVLRTALNKDAAKQSTKG